jgi:hypothetical protein
MACNSYPGQTFGLGVAIVEDAGRSGLVDAAAGWCWWQGIASTFAGFNLRTRAACLVLSQTGMCTSHHEAFADVINATCAYSEKLASLGLASG